MRWKTGEEKETGDGGPEDDKECLPDVRPLRVQPTSPGVRNACFATAAGTEDGGGGSVGPARHRRHSSAILFTAQIARWSAGRRRGRRAGRLGAERTSGGVGGAGTETPPPPVCTRPAPTEAPSPHTYRVSPRARVPRFRRDDSNLSISGNFEMCRTISETFPNRLRGGGFRGRKVLKVPSKS